MNPCGSGAKTEVRDLSDVEANRSEGSGVAAGVGRMWMMGGDP